MSTIINEVLPSGDRHVVIDAPISRRLLASIDDPDSFKAEMACLLSEALQREWFGGLTLAELEEQLLNGTGTGMPLGIIRARVS
jgi:hypothetical protein